MRASCHVYLVSLLAALAIVRGKQGIKYTFTNKASQTVGGELFHSEVGEEHVESIMKLATNHIRRIFRQAESSDNREEVKRIDLFIDEMKESQEASTSELNDQIGQIHISAKHIAKCPDDYVRDYFSDLIYYELTHILLWKAIGHAPAEIRNGIASYVVLVMNEENPWGWVTFGGGDEWNQRGDVTAHFFQFIDYDLCRGFVFKLIEMMKDSYDENYFYKLTGMTIEAAWKQYKARYGKLAS